MMKRLPPCRRGLYTLLSKERGKTYDHMHVCIFSRCLFVSIRRVRALSHELESKAGRPLQSVGAYYHLSSHTSSFFHFFFITYIHKGFFSQQEDGGWCVALGLVDSRRTGTGDRQHSSSSSLAAAATAAASTTQGADRAHPLKASEQQYVTLPILWPGGLLGQRFRICQVCEKSLTESFYMTLLVLERRRPLLLFSFVNSHTHEHHFWKLKSHLSSSLTLTTAPWMTCWTVGTSPWPRFSMRMTSCRRSSRWIPG